MICTKVEGLKPNNYLPGGFGLDFGQNTKPQLFDGNVTPFSLLLTRVRREVERDRVRMLSKGLRLIETDRDFN